MTTGKKGFRSRFFSFFFLEWFPCPLRAGKHVIGTPALNAECGPPALGSFSAAPPDWSRRGAEKTEARSAESGGEPEPARREHQFYARPHSQWVKGKVEWRNQRKGNDLSNPLMHQLWPFGDFREFLGVIPRRQRQWRRVCPGGPPPSPPACRRAAPLPPEQGVGRSRD